MFGPHRELLVPCPKCGSVEHIAKSTRFGPPIEGQLTRADGAVGYAIGCTWCDIWVEVGLLENERLEERWNERVKCLRANI